MRLCKWCDEPLIEHRGNPNYCVHCDELCKRPRGTCGRCALGTRRANNMGNSTP